MAKSKYARSRQHWKKQRKTVHNQNKPFNPGQYGKVWGAIEFIHDWVEHLKVMLKDLLLVN